MCPGTARMTVPAITSLYAGCFTLLFAWANWRLYRFSTHLKVPYRYRSEIVGDVPWLMLLIFLAETSGLSPWVLHAFALPALLTRMRHIAFFVRDLGKWKDHTANLVGLTWLLTGGLAAVLVLHSAGVLSAG